MAIQFHRQGLRRELAACDVRQHALGVNVDGVAAGRLDDRHTGVGDVPAKVVGGYDPVLQVIRVEDLFKAHRDGFEVAAGESAIGGEALRQNKQIGFLHGHPVVIRAQQSADVGEGVLLGGEGAAIRQREHFLRDLFRRPAGITGLALPDEKRVLGETAGVEIEWNPVAGGDALHGLDVGHGNGLAAAGIVGHGQHDQGNPPGAFGFDQPLQRGHVHVAFEIEPGLRVGGLRNGQVDGARAGELDVGACRVEVRIAGYYLFRMANHLKENTLRRAALVGGDDMAETGQIPRDPLHAIEAFAARVGFVAAHHGRPLFGGHGAGTGIGE